jgi:hypothetical protein
MTICGTPKAGVSEKELSEVMGQTQILERIEIIAAPEDIS